MEPGHFAVVSWIPNESIQTTNDFRDTLTLYDAGNIQGFFMKEATGKTTWIVFQVDYRLVQENNVVVEGRTILNESEAPLHYMSIETYPMRLLSQGKFQKTLLLPQVQILMSLSEQPLASPRTLLEQPLAPPHRSMTGHTPPCAAAVAVDGPGSQVAAPRSAAAWAVSPCACW